MRTMRERKGFTLIELLVVIAILAVLAVAVVLVLNPAQLLAEGRDTTRMSDLASVNSALALWTADVIGGTGWTAVTNCTASTTAPGGAANCVLNATTSVTGGGWVPVNFNLISSGSPLPKLPIDPNNGATCLGGSPGAACQYAFIASSTVGVYKLEARMESVKFYSGSGTAVVGNDGGVSTSTYEIGSNLQLAD